LKSLPDAGEQKFTAPTFGRFLARLLEIVSRMAEPLAPSQRGAFLEALAAELAHYPVEALGPGLLPVCLTRLGNSFARVVRRLQPLKEFTRAGNFFSAIFRTVRNLIQFTIRIRRAR
jgi:hypothetical protein